MGRFKEMVMFTTLTNVPEEVTGEMMADYIDGPEFNVSIGASIMKVINGLDIPEDHRDELLSPFWDKALKGVI